MKLFEMRNRLPERAGKAKLIFYDDGKKPQSLGEGRVGRIGTQVFIRNDPLAEFYLLQNGTQFPLRFPEHGTVTTADELYFAGTDEESFCVRLHGREPFEAFIKDGEEGFYDSLCPREAKKVAETFDSQIVRQGDIFAAPLKMPWEELRRTVLLGSGQNLLSKTQKRKSSIFGTRHTLNGYLVQVPLLGRRVDVGEGLLEAPDHSSRELKQVHVLFQTQHLFSPAQAD